MADKDTATPQPDISATETSPPETDERAEFLAGLDGDFQLDDDGVMQVSVPEESDAKAEEPEVKSEPKKDIKASESDDSKSKPPVKAVKPKKGWEERYKDAQAWGTRVSQENAQMRKDLEALKAEFEQAKKGETSPEDESETVEDLISDPGKMKAWVQEVVNEAMTPVKPLVVEAALRAELQEAARNHDDFLDVLPTIHAVFAAAPKGLDLTFEQAYMLAKKLADTEEDSGDDDSGETAADDSLSDDEKPEPTAEKVSAKKLKEKAARLETETGVAEADLSGGKKISSARDAFEQALEELGL